MTTGLFTSGKGSVNAQRVRLSHNNAAIRHMRDGGAQLCAGVTLACRDTPLPPLDAYEAWFASQAVRAASRYFVIDARKVRRIAQMRRNGCTFQEIANVIGGKPRNASKWFAALPKELR